MTAFLTAALVLAVLAVGFSATLGLGAAFLTTALPGEGFFATPLWAATFFVGDFFADAFFRGVFFAATFLAATFFVAAAFFAGALAGAFLIADFGTGFFAAGFAEDLTVGLLALFTFRSLVAAAFDLPALTAALADVSLLRAFAPVELALLFAIFLHHD